VQSAHPKETTVSETGNPQVDAVLRSLDSVADRPVDEHVAVFEAAHAALRDALTTGALTTGDAASATSA
jgi:hypothetical protein